MAPNLAREVNHRFLVRYTTQSEQTPYILMGFRAVIPLKITMGQDQYAEDRSSGDLSRKGKNDRIKGLIGRPPRGR